MSRTYRHKPYKFVVDEYELEHGCNFDTMKHFGDKGQIAFYAKLANRKIRHTHNLDNLLPIVRHTAKWMAS